MKRRRLGSIVARTAFLAALACLPRPAQASSLVTEWLDETIPAANETAWEPTVGARFLSMVHTAIYDAWASYDPVAVGVFSGSSLRGLGGAATDVNKREAISYAAFEVLGQAAPVRRKALAARMLRMGYPPDAQTPAAKVGRMAAAAVIEAYNLDGANSGAGFADTTGYWPAVPATPTSWRPIGALGADQLPLSPHWERVVPFGLSSASQFRPPPPPRPGHPEWDEQIKAILDASAHLTDREKAIAERWIPWGSPPAADLMGMTKFVSARDDLRIDDEVKLFFCVSVALHDTAIATWESKYYYDYVRPVTAVQALGDRRVKVWVPETLPTAFAYSAPATRGLVEEQQDPGEHVATIEAREWQPYLPTPPFPSYVSGHASFTAAWARSMELVTGRAEFGMSMKVDRLFVERRRLDPPINLTYPTFWSAAEASGLSRVYGGIHWPIDNLMGLALGRSIAEASWERAQQFILGTAQPSFAVLHHPQPPYWYPDLKAAPAMHLSLASPGVLGAGVAPDAPAAWISVAADPPPEGTYALTVIVEASGTKSIVTRLAVLRAGLPDVSVTLAVADGSREAGMNLTWHSDGKAPVRFAVSAQSTDGIGTIRLHRFALERVWPTVQGAKRYREMRTAGLNRDNPASASRP